jgi:hypothetical protein
MDNLFLNRLISHICRRLEIKTTDFYLTDDNWTKVLAIICEYCEQIENGQLSGNEKKLLAISWFKRLINENTKTNINLVYPTADGPKDILDNSKLIFISENVISNVIDILIDMSRQDFFINVKPKQELKKTRKRFL